ncbi:MAG TPA: MEMAR_RS02690 family S-layer glycoprotein, partial [Methanoregula sp.]|nr:MEMAR_RS02690 family S-layer glycoprotein [Methanoregula sp.]
MTKRLTIALVAVALFVLLAVMPVSAFLTDANNTVINRTATVFIGEQGLNMTYALNQAQGQATGGMTSGTIDGVPTNLTVGWWASAATITSTAPSAKVDMASSYRAFTVDQQSFVGYTGNWYLLGSDKATALRDAATNPIVAFTVADPRLEIAVWDFQQASDVTGKSVTQGQQLGFSVKTNMIISPTDGLRGNMSNALTTAGNYIDGYITIKVKDESGATLTALANNATTGATPTAVPLTKQFINSQPWYWPYNTNTATTILNYWRTDAADYNNQYSYPVGTYTVWAESTLNKMKDNYKNAGADYTGKTVSATGTITLVSDTVKIEANKDAVVRSKSFSVTITGKPSTTYYVWVKDSSAMTGGYDDQPPTIAANQEKVYFDTPTLVWPGFHPIGNYTKENGGTIWLNVANDTTTQYYNKTRYYAYINTSTSGTRTVEFLTNNWTKAQKYTIRVEQRFANGVALSASNGEPTSTTGTVKCDEVDLNVEKGAVTIVAAGDQSYYLGEEIKFSGTNTETYKTYLFIIGPNLKTSGSQIAPADKDPRSHAVTDGVAADFKQVDVNGDNTWSWKWGTANYALDAGTYTIYAVSQPRNKDSNNLANAAYGTVSIIIKKPFVSATASQSTVAKGDKVFITGTAEGDPGTVQIWIMGKNYAVKKSSSVNSDSSFKYEIKQEDTKDLTSGQYFVVVQHPMQNKVFDVDLVGNNVVNKQLNDVATATTSGTKIFTLLGQGSLQGSDAAEALAEGINDANVDDTYTKLQFLVEEPTITIDTIGDKHVGDKFTITAKTNLAVDDEILVQVYSSSFKPTMKSQSGEFSGASGTVKVTKGDSGYNKISFDVDSSTFKPDEYIVTEEAVLQTATGTALFNVLETTVKTVAPTTAATAVQTPVQTAVPTTVATAVP